MQMRAKALALFAVLLALLIGLGRAIDNHDHLLHPDPTCPICHTQQIQVLESPALDPPHLFCGIFFPLESSPTRIHSLLPENPNFIRGPPLSA